MISLAQWFLRSVAHLIVNSVRHQICLARRCASRTLSMYLPKLPICANEGSQRFSSVTRVLQQILKLKRSHHVSKINLKCFTHLALEQSWHNALILSNTSLLVGGTHSILV